ncbi:MAG: phage tail protein, partial [Cyclobacteriaceae bacterium]|nr:phage tail protein [Cyclobacteriaceae bacterium]
GGSRGQRVTTYSYRASFAIAFGEGPADQVLRIWADGKLILDRTGSAAVSAKTFRLRFYPGDETQLPDPAIVAQEGAGNVPAHRGLCYLVFEDVDLTDFGNRIPQITAEISWRATGRFPVAPLHFTPGPLSSFARAELAVDWARGRGFLSAVSPAGLYRFTLDPMQTDRQLLLDEILATPHDGGGTGLATLFCGADGALYCTLGGSNARPILRIDPDALRETGRFGSAGTGLSNSPTRFALTQRLAMITRGPQSYLLSANGTGPHHLGLIRTSDMGYLWHENELDARIAALAGGAEGEGGVLSGSPDHGQLHRVRLREPDTGGGAGPDTGSVTRDLVWQFTPHEIDPGATQFAGNFATIGAGNFGGLMFDPSDGGLIFWCGVSGADVSGRQYLVKWRPGLGLIWRCLLPIWPSGAANGLPVCTARLTGQRLAIARDIAETGRWRVLEIDLQSGTVLRDADGWVNGRSGLGGAQVYDGVSDSLIAYDPNGRFSRLSLGRYEANATALSGIVAELCARGGLSLADIDVSELSASLPGYVVARGSTIRAALDPLAQAFFFDGVESDDRLAFRNRGRAPACTLNPQHLIRLEAGSGDAWRARRAQEVDLPARVNIVHMDSAAEYAQGTQTARRVARPVPTMASRHQLSLELPMALTAGMAKSIAAQLLYTAWAERSSYEARLPSDYLRLEPTDVIAITLPSGASLVARLERVDLGADVSLVLQARAQDAAEYAPALAADGGRGHPPQSLDQISQTQAFLPDLPLLRDIDDPGSALSRRYAMMAGSGAGNWPGAALWRSADGANWAFVAASSTAVAWGVPQSVLPPPRAVFATDEDSTLTLAMVIGADRLESVTQAALLNGANAALLLRADGTPEIVQFREVELQGNGSFTLRGFLRGRRGTDVFATTPHPVGTRFVLLEPASTLSTVLPLGELGLPRRWRAVSAGAEFDTAPVLEDRAGARSDALCPGATARAPRLRRH